MHHKRTQEAPVLLDITVDITARRSAEEALRESDRNKDLFIATLAHELRNPLSAMSNSVQILEHRGRDEKASKTATDILKRQLGHLGRMVDDLLDVERLTYGRIALQKTRVAVGEIVEAAIENCRPAI